MKFIVFIIVAAIISSCEKSINFSLKNADDILVVDAGIENDKPPVVVLTKSFDYFSSFSPQLLENAFVHHAGIVISNGTLSHTLKEYSSALGNGYYYYYYSIDTADMATAFNGELNKHYSLLIRLDGKEYRSETTIPLVSRKPDSLWYKSAPFSDDTNKVVLMVRSSDPPGLGNCIRYFTRRNSGPFLPGENSVFDDQIIDGTTYELQVDPGVDRNDMVPVDDNFFKKGDTVTLKLCNIDKTTYKFWSTWEFAQSSIGNPFSQPNKVIGNISNGALGAFYGYGAIYKTLVIPK